MASYYLTSMDKNASFACSWLNSLLHSISQIKFSSNWKQLQFTVKDLRLGTAFFFMRADWLYNSHVFSSKYSCNSSKVFTIPPIRFTQLGTTNDCGLLFADRVFFETFTFLPFHEQDSALGAFPSPSAFGSRF